jgi:hypothetical protein
MRRTLSFLLASALLLAGLALAAFEMPSANAADPTYLRCTYTQKMPADPRRFVVLTIEPDHHWIRFDEHGAVLNDTTQYVVLEMNDTTIKGITTTKEGDDQRLEIDRPSGRATISVDETRMADKLWNDKRQQVGGFDLKPGEELWSSMSLDCKPAKPVF